MSRLDSITKQKLRKEFLFNEYPLDLIPTTLDIPNYVEQVDIDVNKEVVKQAVQHKIQQPTEIPIPLTESESELVDQRIAQAIANIDGTKQKIVNTRFEIESRINDQTNESVNFAIDIKKKPRLLRAIKKLWGEKRTEITFEMYKQLLEAKYILESKEVDTFASGKIKR